MIRSLLPILILNIFCSLAVFGQIPSTVVAPNSGQPSPETVLACPNGVNPFAGNTRRTLFTSAASSDVRFLCWEDSMTVEHLGDQDLSGDPVAGTNPGVIYVFYADAPTIMGQTLQDVESDPNLLLTPPPPAGAVNANFWAALPGTVDFSTVFFNNTITTPFGNSLPEIFNGGDPIEIWFAPMTIDDYTNSAFEQSGGSGPAGPCVNVNTDSAFSVVYLNPIDISTPVITQGSEGCEARFTVTGGLPEFLDTPGAFFSLSAVLTTDNSVQARITGDGSGGAIGQDSTVIMSVNEPGTYELTIEDGVSCIRTFMVNMPGCVPVSFEIEDVCAPPGSNVCIPVTTRNFNQVVSFQYSIRYDDNMLQFTGFNEGVLLEPNLAAVPNGPGEIVTNYLDFLGTPLTIADDEILFELCFDVIGPLNNTVDIEFLDAPLGPEITGPNGARKGFEGTNGTADISTCPLTVIASSCSGRVDAGNPNAGTGGFGLTATSGTLPINLTYTLVGNPSVSGTAVITLLGDQVFISNLPPGTYNIVATDASSTVTNLTVTIVNGDPLFVQSVFQNPICNGDMNGLVGLIINGGVAPVDITWSTGPADNNRDTLFNLGGGMYSATITDANGCQSVALQNIGTSAISVDTVITGVTCNGNGMDGSIDLTVSGGAGNYDFTWADGIFTEDRIGIGVGNYSVIITDGNNCSTGQLTFTVGQAPGPEIISWDSTSISCRNAMDGTLTVNALARPGTSIANYVWTFPDGSTSNSSSPSLINLGGGQYIVNVFGSDGCSTADTVVLGEPQGIVLNVFDLVPPTCPGELDGQIVASATSPGGVVQYFWSTGEVNSTGQIFSLAGNERYQVTIVDASRCDSIIIDTLLPDPPGIDIVFVPSSIQGVSCNDNITCDGQATVIASGGTSGNNTYSFFWANGETGLNDTAHTAVNLCAGINQVVVTDGACPDTATIDIPAPEVLAIDPAQIQFNAPSCNDFMDGSITVQGIGGTPDYTYEWDDTSTGPTLSGLPAGTYMVTVTDFNGCTADATLALTEPDILDIGIDTVNTRNVNCAGDNDGIIALSVAGGTPDYNYLWAGGVATNSTAINLSPGSYFVTVTDANGCSDSISYDIMEPTPLEATAPRFEEPQCFGFTTTVTVDSAFGGNGGPYTFQVLNAGGIPRRIGQNIAVAAGTHTVRVFDGNGCTIDTIISIGQPLPVTAALGEDRELSLGDSVLVTLNTNVIPDTILWQPFDTTINCFSVDCRQVYLSPLRTTTYEVTVIDQNGCIGTDEIEIDVDRNRNVFIPNIFTPNGDGENDLFRIFAGTGVTNVNYFRVYDRWGEVVYEKSDFLPNNAIDDPTEGWNGFVNGKRMNPAVFVYLAEVEFVDGVVLLYRGDVTLFR